MIDNESNTEKLAGYAVQGVRLAIFGAKLYVSWVLIVGLALVIIMAVAAFMQRTPDVYGSNRYTPYHGFDTTPGAGNFKP